MSPLPASTERPSSTFNTPTRNRGSVDCCTTVREIAMHDEVVTEHSTRSLPGVAEWWNRAPLQGKVSLPPGKMLLCSGSRSAEPSLVAVAPLPAATAVGPCRTSRLSPALSASPYVTSAHRAAFAAAVATRGQMMPRLVERELDGYVGCGVLARGFARVRCGACGHELLVPFSCKRPMSAPPKAYTS